jgi:hypothetical protein
MKLVVEHQTRPEEVQAMLEFDFEDMERRINDWLVQTGAKALQITAKIAPQGEGLRNRVEAQPA